MIEQDRIEKLRKLLPAYLSSKGIDTVRHFRCLCPEHEDVHPSMGYDGQRNKVHCFSCGFDGDIFDLVGKEHDIKGFVDQVKFIDNLVETQGICTTKKGDENMDHYVIPKADKRYATSTDAWDPSKPDLQEGIKNAAAQAHMTEYFHERGLSDKIIKKYQLGYIRPSPSYPFERFVIPTSTSGVQVRIVGEGVMHAGRYFVEGHDQFFMGMNLLNDVNRPIFIVEGAFDALSIEEVGGVAVALGGVKYFGLLRMLSLNYAKLRYPLLLALDNDSSGKETTIKLCSGLTKNGISHRVVDIVGKCKDPNEAFVADRKTFAKRVHQAEYDAAPHVKARDSYVENDAGKYARKLFNEKKGKDAVVCLSTGFHRLDEALGGGMYEGLICLGAITSLGKTTMALQIADAVVKQSRDVLFFSMEMSRRELISKSISRETLMSCLREEVAVENALTMREVMELTTETLNDLKGGILKSSLEFYADASKNRMYIYEGTAKMTMDAIHEQVSMHVERKGSNPVVIVDYLQILAPYTAHATDKQSVDQIVIELKRLSREYHIPIIAISSFNRSNYTGPVKMEAFKESGAIEYSADVLLGLQFVGTGQKDFDTMQAKCKNPREVELWILKNRSGMAGSCVTFDYYAKHNMFWEKEEPLPTKAAPREG